MNDVPIAKVNAAIDSLVRDAWGQTLSAVAYKVRDLQLAEDCLQEAILLAWKSWPKKGIPDHPKAWLYRIAIRKAIDQIRRRENFQSKSKEIEQLHSLEKTIRSDSSDTEIPDERLRLIFTCCHPSLEKNSSVALTLRTVCGLQTREIARAFIVEEPTMAQRLTRAKRKIRAAGIPYRVPPPELWPERLDAALSVLYFIFNEGYQATSGGNLLRRDLCEEAIHLTKAFCQLAPQATEAKGLLALMLAHHARHKARTQADNTLVTLEQQDRSQWNQREIAEADQTLTSALKEGQPGPYQIQAAISVLHCKAKSWASTDWIQIDMLYRELYRIQPNNVVHLNQIVARSMYANPAEALAELETLENELQNYQPFHASKADLYRRVGNPVEADKSYQRAIELSSNETERRFLEACQKELRKG